MERGQNTAPSRDGGLGQSLESSTLGVGFAAGICGMFYGSLAGTYINTPYRVLYPALSGTQWFCAGATGFYIRGSLLSGWLSRDDNLQLIAASSAAGTCSGAVAGAFLPRGSILRGSILFTILAAAGQASFNLMSRSPGQSGQSLPAPEQQRWSLARWIPMKALSDEEYEDILQSKLLKVEVEIALLDDQIAQLRAAKTQSGNLKESSG